MGLITKTRTTILVSGAMKPWRQTVPIGLLQQRHLPPFPGQSTFRVGGPFSYFWVLLTFVYSAYIKASVRTMPPSSLARHLILFASPSFCIGFSKFAQLRFHIATYQSALLHCYIVGVPPVQSSLLVTQRMVSPR